mmetsp:Transcript_767/g.1617  ORF Transcript_767/g.1617 Transcript_767/m.1617 type:complete len:91 (+) Transcript_767:1329-1601(+)
MRQKFLDKWLGCVPKGAVCLLMGETRATLEPERPETHLGVTKYETHNSNKSQMAIVETAARAIMRVKIGVNLADRPLIVNEISKEAKKFW